jgi:hypothetical protein
MGLYLAIFDDGSEVDGVEIGSYSDFGSFRDRIVNDLEGRRAGSRFPMLILHSDCDGQWSPMEAAALEKELDQISREFRERPPVPLGSEWQQQAAKKFGLQINSLYDCYFDVDGEPLLERLIGLAKISQDTNLPILFQ